jgi:alanyl-tRNA synthetase
MLMQLQDIVAGMPPTTFHYWTEPYAKTHKAAILRAIPEDRRDVYLTLDSTIFHPKSGGQPSDKGTIRAEDFQVQIKKSMLVGKSIVLWGRILEGTPRPAPITEEIDWNWRYLLMRRHTAAHLFDHCLSSILGSEVETTDSWLGDPCYAGYKGQAVANEKLERAATLENELITKGLEVRTETISRTDLTALAAKAPNLWRMPEMEEYRIVTIEGCTPIPCGGTHVRNASESKEFHFERVEQLPDSFRVYFDLA